MHGNVGAEDSVRVPSEAPQSSHSPQTFPQATTRSPRALSNENIRWSKARYDILIFENIYQSPNREAERHCAQDPPDVKERMGQLGADDARTATPEAFAAMMKSELARYANVVKAAGIRIE